ncbi:hypothetical protein [Dyella sp. A6]|uniref:hypothetical protein n=1 Tax=Dyella aluminiiresistens TaxID=3069105 RepID=UPI002E7A3119|nr:hypothetical protein [Dyella sp. A6]
MAPELSTIQIQIWVLAGVIGMLMIGNILYKFAPSSADREARRLQRLLESKQLTKLLSRVNEGLEDAPASSMYLMYKTQVLLRLGRLEEAERAAWEFKKAAPEWRTTAVNLIDFIADLRCKLEQQKIPEHDFPALLASKLDAQ